MKEEVFFDYGFPPELVAQAPAPERGGSRLMVVDRRTGRLEDSVFDTLPSRLGKGDLLVLNDTRVVPSRITARKSGTGGRVELLFLDWAGPVWRALVKGSVGPGARLEVEGWPVALKVVGGGEGEAAVEAPAADAAAFFGKTGHMPLPPYIRRPAGEDDARDRERYQTVYASEDGSVAAPTAGLHFTGDLLRRAREAGAKTAFLTLHVGWGTFSPVRGDWREHRLHPETASLSEETARAVNDTVAAGGKVVAVGTTAVRVLESAWNTEAGAVEPFEGKVDLYINPGFSFHVTGAMLTNFHRPRSSLLLLVDSFAGSDLVRLAYAEAVRLRYRLFSYGDAMLIL